MFAESEYWVKPISESLKMEEAFLGRDGSPRRDRRRRIFNRRSDAIVYGSPYQKAAALVDLVRWFFVFLLKSWLLRKCSCYVAVGFLGFWCGGVVSYSWLVVNEVCFKSLKNVVYLGVVHLVSIGRCFLCFLCRMCVCLREFQCHVFFLVFMVTFVRVCRVSGLFHQMNVSIDQLCLNLDF